jgi:hypothetical protein
MKLSDALERGQQKYQEARKKEQEKRRQRPVTTSGLIQFFSDLYDKAGLGRPPVLSKENRGKISGLIKLLKNNGYENKDIYDFIEQIFDSWDQFKQQEFQTLHKKKYVLSAWPDLMDIVNCRDQFIRELSKEEDTLHNECNEDLLTMWENQE